jgi:dihydroorotase
MYDMRSSGAIAFSDGLHPVQSAGLLVKALQYVRTFDGVVIQIPDDRSIAPHGLMHEGVVSTRIGLAGKPIMAEELCVARDIKLARYAESRIHFTGVTSPRSLDYIRRAKDSGLNVTCSVTPYHLYFTDEDMMGYDTNLKVYPPLRTRTQVEALKKAVLDGTIDCIATHHLPHEKDSKVTEFEYAAAGMIGLETCFGVLRTALPELAPEKWVELLGINPRKIFGLPQGKIDIGQPAILSLFQPDAEYPVTEQHIHSRSLNTPFLGRKLTGSAKGIIHQNHIRISE